MSNALAVAGVTAVIKDLLDSGMIDHKVTDSMGQGVAVTAIAPDIIALGNDSKPQLNLFLYQLTPNAAWRNACLPSRDSRGQPISNPPLALDLHYMITAYGSGDLQAEILLGYALQLLHETPVLTRDAIRTALNPPTPPVTGSLLPSVYQALRASDLADQFEQIKLTPETMNTEELSKLWTALQSHYRPTATYVATVVLLQPSAASRAALPVLTRGPVDPATLQERGVIAQAGVISPFAEIQGITLPHAQIAAQLDDVFTVNGSNIDGVATQYALLLSNPRLGFNETIAPEIANTGSGAAVNFRLPNDAANYPAGNHSATLQLLKAGESVQRVTNSVPFSIAPQITALPATANLVGGNLTLTPTCTPAVRPNQSVSLILGDIATNADPFSAATTTPSFTFNSLPTGKYWVRLRVDGVDSLLINRESKPPSFNGPQIQVLP